MSPFTRFVERVPRSLLSVHGSIRFPIYINGKSSYSTKPEPAPGETLHQLSNYEKFRCAPTRPPLTSRLDLKTAMRDRDTKTLNPLKSLLTIHQSSSKDHARNKPNTPDSHFKSDDFFAPLIHRQIAKRQESIIGFKEYHRMDLVEKESYEISVLKQYLPRPQTTEEDVRNWTNEAVESLRTEGKGANDPGSMSVKRIYEWLFRDEARRKALGPVRIDQGMMRRVVAETIRDLSDRIDNGPDLTVEKLKPKPKDELTKDRYQ